MDSLRIFADLPMSEAALRTLREGLEPHELRVPDASSASVLAGSGEHIEHSRSDIIMGQVPVTSVMEAENLRWLHITSAGFTRYDSPEFRAHCEGSGLVVTNSSAVYSGPCAEHVLAFLLAQSRCLAQAVRSRAAAGSPEWLQIRSDSVLLASSNVLIVGHGAISERLVELLKPFGVRLTAVRRTVRGDESVRTIALDQLDEAMAVADHVINILPENDQSKGFFSSERFSKMREGAVFYNIGRGGTVDQDALAKALHHGHLGAAWLDVTDPEPLPTDHPLREAPNCYITPHTAGGQGDESMAMVEHFLANFQRFLKGEELVDRIY